VCCSLLGSVEFSSYQLTQVLNSPLVPNVVSLISLLIGGVQLPDDYCKSIFQCENKTLIRCKMILESKNITEKN